MFLKNSLEQSHQIIKSIVQKGDIVIDATAGNGNDTIMLSRLVGSKGKVYAFDIQDAAINNTLKKIEESGLTDRVSVIMAGHQNMDKYINGSVKAVMFNLGYLPGGDHNISTKAHTTITAVKKSMELLDYNGIITIVIYCGGDSGFEEKEMVIEFLKGIDPKQYIVMKTEFINQLNNPPILICIEKIYIAK